MGESQLPRGRDPVALRCEGIDEPRCRCWATAGNCFRDLVTSETSRLWRTGVDRGIEPWHPSLWQRCLPQHLGYALWRVGLEHRCIRVRLLSMRVQAQVGRRSIRKIQARRSMVTFAKTSYGRHCIRRGAPWCLLQHVSVSVIPQFCARAGTDVTAHGV